jgi:hypothetical protein
MIGNVSAGAEAAAGAVEAAGVSASGIAGAGVVSAGASAGVSAVHGGFLYACVTHCGQFSHDERWAALSIEGVSLRQAFTDWLDGKAAAVPYSVDCDGPGCNPTCCDKEE